MALFSRRVFLDVPAIAILGPTPVIIVSQNVGFQAKAVAVDNYSAYYIYLKDADSYIPPFWGGAVRVLYHTTDFAYAELSSPFGDPQLPSDPSFFCEFTWTDADSPFTPGGSIAGTSAVIPPLFVLDVFQVAFETTVVPLTAGIAIPIPATPFAARTSLMLQAPASNTSVIYLGGPAVTANEAITGGVQLFPGQSLPIEAAFGAVPWVVSPINGQHVIVLEGK